MQITLDVDNSIYQDFLELLKKLPKEKIAIKNEKKNYSYINDIGEEIVVKNGILYVKESEEDLKAYKKAKEEQENGESISHEELKKRLGF